MRIEGRTAVVTGARRGLGLALTQRLLERDATVVATVRNIDEPAGLAPLGTRWGERVRLVELDVTSEADLATLDERLGDIGLVDLLVNNAGVWSSAGSAPDPASVGPLEALERSALEQVLDVNALGPLLVTRALMDRLSPGAVVANLSSGLGSLGRDVPRMNYGYALSKAALHAVTRYLAADLADRPATVVALDPGWVATDLGGTSAPLSPAGSARDLVDVLAGLDATASGEFRNRHGEQVPW